MSNWATHLDPDRLRREIPWSALTRHRSSDDGYQPDMGDDARVMVSTVPLTPVEALLRAAPGDTPTTSALEAQALRELLVDAIDRLDDRDRYIFDAIAIRRIAIRKVAAELSLAKSHVHRVYRRTCEALAVELEDDPLIAPRLRRDTKIESSIGTTDDLGHP